MGGLPLRYIVQIKISTDLSFGSTQIELDPTRSKWIPSRLYLDVL